ncbi:MAG: hypothetical protein HY074_01720, partial [Deltaproteobacteria bacterium]|nr:hypothetical protein [Deltaproteobacteria bacterium]
MKISITGVDGTGKTSIIRALQQQFAGSPTHVQAFRAPQYHENPDAPFSKFSTSIDALSVLADKTGDPLLKTCALFLSMTLYGDVEAHYEHAFHPRFLFSERQALADSLAYSKFYKGLLTGPLKPRKLESQGALEDWLLVLRSRLPAKSSIHADKLALWNLPLFIRELFELEPDDLVEHLKALYHCSYPDQIVFLKVSSPRLMERLAQKAAGGTQKELHEKKHVLEALQAGLEQCCQV